MTCPPCHPHERRASQALPRPESGASPEVGQKEGQAGEAAVKRGGLQSAWWKGSDSAARGSAAAASLEGELHRGAAAAWEERGARGAAPPGRGMRREPSLLPGQTAAAGVCWSAGALPISSAVFLYKVPFVTAAVGEPVPPPTLLLEASAGLSAGLSSQLALGELVRRCPEGSTEFRAQWGGFGV